jgi:WD40 repeat protein
MNRSLFVVILTASSLFLALEGRTQNGQDRPELKLPIGHVGKINAIDISPDNKYIATAGDDNSVILWDAATGTELKAVTLQRAVKNVFFSPDSKYFYAVANEADGIVLTRAAFYKCEVKTGNKVDTLPFFGGQQAYLSPDANYMLVRGLRQRSEKGSNKEVLTSADSTKQNNGILGLMEWEVWDIPGKRQVHEYYNPGTEARFILLNGTEYMLTGGRTALDQEKIKHDMDSLQKKQQADINAAANKPDTSSALLAAKSNLEKLLSDPTRLAKFKDSIYYYQGIMAKEIGTRGVRVYKNIREKGLDAQRRAFSTTPIIQLWNFREKQTTPIRSFYPSNNVKLLVAASKGNALATADDKGDIELWDLNTDNPVKRSIKTDNALQWMEFSANGQLLLTLTRKDEIQKITIYNTPNGTIVNTIQLPSIVNSTTAKFSPDGHFFVLTGDVNIGTGNIGMLYTSSGRLIRKLEQHALQSHEYYFSTDGHHVYTDYGYQPPSEEQRRQNFGAMENIRKKLSLLSNSEENANTTRKRDSLLGEVNKQIKKQMAQKTKKELRVWDLSLGKVFKILPDGLAFTKDSVSPDKNYLLTSEIRRTGMKETWGNLFDSGALKDLTGQETKGTGINLGDEVRNPNSEVNRVFTQSTLLINKQKKDTVALISIDSSDWIIVNRQGYYMCSRNSARELRYELNDKIYYFDQFDLQFNRPDKVLEGIGIAPKDVIETFRKIYEKRVRTMGFSPDSLDSELSLNAPDINIGGEEGIYKSSTSKQFNFTLTASDKKYALQWVHIMVNGVPEQGMKGYYIGDKRSMTLQRDFSIELSTGNNAIEVSVTNEKGVSSLTQRFEVEYIGSNIKSN